MDEFRGLWWLNPKRFKVGQKHANRMGSGRIEAEGGGGDSKGQFAGMRTQLLHPARAPAAYSPRHQSTMEVAWDAELPKDCRHPKP